MKQLKSHLFGDYGPYVVNIGIVFTQTEPYVIKAVILVPKCEVYSVTTYHKNVLPASSIFVFHLALADFLVLLHLPMSIGFDSKKSVTIMSSTMPMMI